MPVPQHEFDQTMVALHDILSAIGAERDFDALARLVTARAADLLGADGCLLDTWDERAGVIRAVAAVGISDPLPLARVRLRQGIAGQTAERRDVVMVEDYAAWEHAVAAPSGRRHGAGMGAPLLVADRLIGVLVVQYCEPRQFTAADTQLLGMVAAVIAPALDAALLYKASTSLYERERQLRDMSRALASDLEEDNVLTLAAQQAGDLVDAPFSRIWLVRPDGNLVCSAGAGFGDADLGSVLPLDSLSGSAASQDRPVHVDDLTTHPGWRSPAFLDRTGLRAYLAVPIHRANQTLGVIVTMRTGDAIFREVDEHLLAGLADAVAVALVNARTLDRLEASEGRLRAIYEAIACGVLVQDAEGTILHANAAAEALFGYRLEEMLGRKSSELWKVLGEDGLERAVSSRNVLIAARTGQVRANFTTCIVAPGAPPRWLQANAVPMTGDDGMIKVVTSFIDISERKRAEEAMAHQAEHDALTGLPNRSLLADRLGDAIRTGDATSTQVGLLLMDLDHFKEVNDTLGHQAGDTLLKQVAERLQAVVRGTDTVARLGGDEFAILLPGASADDSLAVAHDILAALKAPLDIECQAIAISGSIGVAVYPTQGMDPTTLLRRADVAMYVAKRSDTGVALYCTDHDVRAPDRMSLLPQLRAAIDEPSDRNCLVLHYQPKLDLTTGELSGVEALVRWQHPQHGLLAPDRFISLAEQTNLIRPISRWVISTALQQVADWAAAGRHIGVAVNLSMRDLEDSELPGRVEQMLRCAGIAPTSLCIEITESRLMADPQRASDVLTRLRATGVTVSMDDFGTGYSSLAHLKRLPVDELKIDRSFVRDISGNSHDRAIVRSVIDLAHSLGLRVVAEGIEDRETWRLIQALGCDYAQGYYLSRPLAAAQFATWLALGRQAA